MSLCELCAQLQFERLAYRDKPVYKPDWYEKQYGLDDKDGGRGKVSTADEDFPRGRGDYRMQFGLISDITKREKTCVLCNVVARCLERERCLPGETYEATSSTYAATVTGPRRLRELESGRMNFAIVPEAGDTYWGPYLPHEKPTASANQRRVFLELQECSNPIPRTDEFPLKPQNKSTVEVQSRFSGRLMNQSADLSLVTHWIHHCEELHGDKCMESIWPSNVPRTLVSLLLIDVKRMCIVEAPENSSYVALSYCWGKAATLKHEVGNSQFLRSNGALLEAKIPATIMDAITVVQRVGESYLWVDALCIIQDDPSSQKVQLAQMGLIYSMAAFVIIAAAGEDADAGLPGLRPGTRRMKQELLQIGGKILLTVIDGPDYYGGVGSSHWNTRGWTMQEKVLSKRSLIFTEEQVYWRCWGGVWLEETVLENASDFVLNRYPAVAGPANVDIDFSTALEDYYPLYESLVVTYMRRQLSFQSDILNAFTGISQALSAIGNDAFHWGLPKSRFGYALSWNLTGPGLKNQALCPIFTDSLSVLQVKYPSWSWTAWTTGDAHNWISWIASPAEEPDIIFYHQSVNGELQIIQDSDRIPESALSQTVDRTDKDKLQELRAQWKGYPQVITELPDTALGNNFDQGQLYFWTSTARLYVRRQKMLPRTGYSLLVPTASGQGFEHGGLVSIESSEHIPFRDPEVMATLPQSVLSQDSDLTEFHAMTDIFVRELVIVGRVPIVADSKPQLTALVVEWDGDVAYRIGLAWLRESVWARQKNREWKQITLA